jgi:AhpD family alkylhydroperoxidase
MPTKTAQRFKLVSYEDASPRVKDIYNQTMKSLQLPFVLNWFKCQGNNATLLDGNWQKLKATLLEGNVPNILKQLIIYNVSQERGCDYCAKAHGIFANSMSNLLSSDLNYKVTDDLNSPSLPDSYKTAIKVVTKAALHTDKLTDDDFDLLAADGFTEGEIQELMAQADLVNMLNTIATISGIKVDNELLETEF